MQQNGNFSAKGRGGRGVKFHDPSWSRSIVCVTAFFKIAPLRVDQCQTTAEKISFGMKKPPKVSLGGLFYAAERYGQGQDQPWRAL